MGRGGKPKAEPSQVKERSNEQRKGVKPSVLQSEDGRKGCEEVNRETAAEASANKGARKR